MKKSDMIFELWTRIDKASRSENDVVELADEVWHMGLKLCENRATHYQMVMQLLRFSTRD